MNVPYSEDTMFIITGVDQTPHLLRTAEEFNTKIGEYLHAGYVVINIETGDYLAPDGRRGNCDIPELVFASLTEAGVITPGETKHAVLNRYNPDNHIHTTLLQETPFDLP